MNQEDHTSPLNNQDSSPFPYPQSPGLPHLHHRPTTDDHDDPTSAAGLRRRRHPEADELSIDNAPPGSSMKVRIQTPFSDSDSGESSRKEVLVDRSMLVSRFKDDIAAGRWGHEGWIRDGMRLVWRGRIAGDGETLGSVVRDTTDQVQTFHLVARSYGSPSGSSPRHSTFRRPDGPQVATAPSVETTEASNSPRNRTSIALQDSIHYLYFVARYHLCRLLDAEPLAWAETIPPPVIDQTAAEQAVRSVVKRIAQTRMPREAGWEHWEQAFEGIDSVLSGTRSSMEDEIKHLWSASTGRAWSDNHLGNEVAVEFDQMTYTLNLPPFRSMDNPHIAHLLLYLRATALIPILLPIVEHESRAPTPPTALASPTRVVPATPQRQPQVRVLMRLQVSLPPLSILTHMAYSALKIAAILWMLCRNMKWSDVRFWIMAGAAAGWWVGDGLNAWMRERPRAIVRPDVAPPAAANGGEGGNVQVGRPEGAAPAGGQGANPAGSRVRPAPPPSFASATAFVPLIHLSTDSAQLGHPSINAAQQTRNPARRIPTRLQTQFLLPIALWFVTLIPEWESARARAIRQRERAMRVVVGELTNASQIQGEAAEGQIEQIYPAGLNPVAKRYYRRVMRRGEGVDWEEEREAQRALGIPDEDAGGDGDEMRMRMV